jgi:hypothetical protein
LGNSGSDEQALHLTQVTTPTKGVAPIPMCMHASQDGTVHNTHRIEEEWIHLTHQILHTLFSTDARHAFVAPER